MTTPVNPDIATVRILADVTDTDWPDATVQSLLDLQGGAIKLAAANLLEILAGRLRSVESDEVKLDQSKRAQTLMDRATALRTQYYEQEGGDFYFDTACVAQRTWVDEWFGVEGLIGVDETGI